MYTGIVKNIDDHRLEIWVKGAQEGDSEAFRHIFDLLSDQLFTYALSHTKSRDEATDLVQETFIDLWKALQKFTYKSKSQFYGFVYIILKRKLYKIFRRTLSSVELEETQIADSYEIKIEDYRYLEKKLHKLPERYQELLRLRYWSELSFSEIAACLNTNESTAKVWHHRALKVLNEQLQNSDY